LGVAFNGWADVDQALSASAQVVNSLVGVKYISAGGGNDNGKFTSARLDGWVNAINSGKLSAYGGVALDVEECASSGLASGFLRVTAAAKAKGMQTIVTVSHSAPYGCSDKVALMNAFFGDSNTDYLSPQLYTSGNEASPDFTADAVSWESYAGAHASLIPSIVNGGHFAATSSYFASKGLTVKGYVQWAHASEDAKVV